MLPTNTWASPGKFGNEDGFPGTDPHGVRANISALRTENMFPKRFGIYRYGIIGHYGFSSANRAGNIGAADATFFAGDYGPRVVGDRFEDRVFPVRQLETDAFVAAAEVARQIGFMLGLHSDGEAVVNDETKLDVSGQVNCKLSYPSLMNESYRYSRGGLWSAFSRQQSQIGLSGGHLSALIDLAGMERIRLDTSIPFSAAKHLAGACGLQAQNIRPSIVGDDNSPARFNWDQDADFDETDGPESGNYSTFRFDIDSCAPLHALNYAEASHCGVSPFFLDFIEENVQPDAFALDSLQIGEIPGGTDFVGVHGGPAVAALPSYAQESGHVYWDLYGNNPEQSVLVFGLAPKITGLPPNAAATGEIRYTSIDPDGLHDFFRQCDTGPATCPSDWLNRTSPSGFPLVIPNPGNIVFYPALPNVEVEQPIAAITFVNPGIANPALLGLNVIPGMSEIGRPGVMVFAVAGSGANADGLYYNFTFDGLSWAGWRRMLATVGPSTVGFANFSVATSGDEIAVLGSDRMGSPIFGWKWTRTSVSDAIANQWSPWLPVVMALPDDSDTMLFPPSPAARDQFEIAGYWSRAAVNEPGTGRIRMDDLHSHCGALPLGERCGGFAFYARTPAGFVLLRQRPGSIIWDVIPSFPTDDLEIAPGDSILDYIADTVYDPLGGTYARVQTFFQSMREWNPSESALYINGLDDIRGRLAVFLPQEQILIPMNANWQVFLPPDYAKNIPDPSASVSQGTESLARFLGVWELHPKTGHFAWDGLAGGGKDRTAFFARVVPGPTRITSWAGALSPPKFSLVFRFEEQGDVSWPRVIRYGRFGSFLDSLFRRGAIGFIHHYDGILQGELTETEIDKVRLGHKNRDEKPFDTSPLSPTEQVAAQRFTQLRNHVLNRWDGANFDMKSLARDFNDWSIIRRKLAASPPQGGLGPLPDPVPPLTAYSFSEQGPRPRLSETE